LKVASERFSRILYPKSVDSKLVDEFHTPMSGLPVDAKLVKIDV
jgi:hypothetical protein